MAIILGGNVINNVKVGTTDVQKIYKGLNLLWQSNLPSGTVLLEHHNTVERTYSTFELLLPTEQEIEVVIVGGGGGTAGCQADI